MSNFIAITDPTTGQVIVVTRDQFDDKAWDDVAWDCVCIISVALMIFILILIVLTALLMHWIFA